MVDDENGPAPEAESVGVVSKCKQVWNGLAKKAKIAVIGGTLIVAWLLISNWTRSIEKIDSVQEEEMVRAGWQKMTEAEAEAECWSFEAISNKDNGAVSGWPKGWFAHECLVESAIKYKPDLPETTKERWRSQYQKTRAAMRVIIRQQVCASLRERGITPEEDQRQRQSLANDLADAMGRERKMADKAECQDSEDSAAEVVREDSDEHYEAKDVLSTKTIEDEARSVEHKRLWLAAEKWARKTGVRPEDCVVSLTFDPATGRFTKRSSMPGAGVGYSLTCEEAYRSPFYSWPAPSRVGVMLTVEDVRRHGRELGVRSSGGAKTANDDELLEHCHVIVGFLSDGRAAEAIECFWLPGSEPGTRANTAFIVETEDGKRGVSRFNDRKADFKRRNPKRDPVEIARVEELGAHHVMCTSRASKRELTPPDGGRPLDGVTYNRFWYHTCMLESPHLTVFETSEYVKLVEIQVDYIRRMARFPQRH